jgi:hypothetical protein
MNDYGTRFALGCFIIAAVAFVALGYLMYCIQEYAKK